MSFDPMTGELIEEEKEIEMNFDPMTGEPVKGTKEPEMSFDPMTGEPMQGAKEPEMNFDPMTGQPIYNNQAPKRGKFKYILMAGVGIVAVGVIVFSGVVSGAFLGKGNKVLLATANTIKEENHLAKDLSGAVEAVLSGKYTMTVNGEAEDCDVDITYLQDSDNKQVKGTVDTGDLDIEFDAVLNKKQVMAKFPTFSDKVFVYNYTEEKDGYFVDEMGEKSIAAIDQMIQSAYSSKEQEEVVEELTNAVMEEYKELEFETVDKETYKIDGKERKCKGYELTIDSDNLLDIMDNVEDVLEERYEESMKEVKLDDMMSELRRELREMPEIDVTFYIYKNKLACVRMEAEGNEAELQFLGGDTRMQNMVLEIEDEEILEVKGSTKDKEERTRIYVDGKEYCEVKYDYKEGDLELEASNMVISAKVDSGRNGVVVDLDEFSVGGSFIGIEGAISIQKGAKVKEIEGETFDIGNASKSDIRDLQEEFDSLDAGGTFF